MEMAQNPALTLTNAWKGLTTAIKMLPVLTMMAVLRVSVIVDMLEMDWYA